MVIRVSVSSFFNESTEQSRIKAEIVSKYLWAWAKVIIPTTKIRDNRIAYIDLFAGTGKYQDGTKSTPLLILEKAIRDQDMRNMLVTIFNDADPNNMKSLESNINSIAGIKTLKYQPQIYTDTVDQKFPDIFQSTRMIPSLTFLDPWGYKGLSYQLINSVIKDWGCDCIVFFNYNRINMGLANNSVKNHIDALFGLKRAEELRQRIRTLKVEEREQVILTNLEDTMKEIGGDYLLPFRFRSERGNRISHHLVFVSKHRKGYDIMKEIMAKASSSENQGVPSFEYSPMKTIQLNLFPQDSSLYNLKESLFAEFKGQTMSVLEIFDKHNIGTKYRKRNYKKVLLELENAGVIMTRPSPSERKKNTIGDSVVVTFI